jgi:hypothetical protein
MMSARNILPLIFLVPLVATGCQHETAQRDSVQQDASAVTQTTTAPATQILGVDPGWEFAPQAHYTATQSNGQVVLKATGEHPTAGYAIKLAQSPLRIWPPRYMLVQRKPDGMVAQVITPFEVRASFKSADQVTQLHVSDAAGEHVVNVEQAQD